MAVINVVSVSGGKDSTAMYCLAVETFGQDFLPLFADTGHEHPVTVNYVRNLHVMAGGPKVVIVERDFRDEITKKRQRYLKELKVLSMKRQLKQEGNPAYQGFDTDEYHDLLYRARNCVPSGNPFLDMMLWKGRAPSAAAQFCTEAVKLWPIKAYMEEHYPLDEWVMYTGLRAGESESRAKRQPFENNDYFDCENVNPMLYCTTEDIFALLAEKAVPPNPLYALRYRRVGCFPCIHSNKQELEILPDWAWDKLDYWEKRIGRTWFAPDTMPFTKEQKEKMKRAVKAKDEDLIKKLKGEFLPTISRVRQWSRTLRGGVHFDLFKQQSETADAPACMSTWGHCE